MNSNHIDMYMLHDPLANVEAMLTVFDQSSLKEAEDHGMLFIAVHSDGTREVVKAKDVHEPTTHTSSLGGFEVVAPVYVDKRTAATVSVFDALSAIVDPQAATLSADGAATAEDPIEAFRSALAALKSLEAKE